jgi:DNA-binding NarL/FixJ family response regulator
MVGKLITAVIVDDHAVVAAGVGTWCAAADPPINIINAGSNIGDVWTGPGSLAEVVIFDLQLSPGRQEFGELRRLIDAGRRVVVYSQTADRETSIKCIELGALAYVTKLEGSDHLVAAIHAAAGGRAYTPPSLSGAIAADASPNRPRLTKMEVAALRAWFASSSKKLAAEMLGIKPSTIESYIDRVRIRYANAGRPAPTKAALVTRALDDGIITLNELREAQS